MLKLDPNPSLSNGLCCLTRPPSGELSANNLGLFSTVESTGAVFNNPFAYVGVLVRLREGISSQASTILVLVVGILIGTALAIATLYASGSIAQRTVTSVSTEVSVSTRFLQTTTVTVVTTPSTSVSYAQVSASVVACVGNPGNHTAYCKLSLINTGSTNVDVQSGFINVGGINTQIVSSNPAIPFTLVTGGGPVVAYIHLPGSVEGGAPGSQVVGYLGLSYGALIPFSGTWS